MRTEKERLEREIASLKQELQQLPMGKLIYASTGKYRKWYQSDGKHKHYIPKRNRKLAEKLAEKKYLSHLLEDLVAEKRAIEFYLRHHQSDIGKTEQILTAMPEYQELLAPYFIPQSQELNNWMHQSYERNLKNPEGLIHKGCFGKYVRSKSEAIIDMFLHMYKIPYRYECALHIEGITLFPDFTIKHPVTGKTYYWEHFGLMDKPSYAKNAASKLELYISKGIIPSIHLITTYETQEHPLSTEAVRKIIEEYFL